MRKSSRRRSGKAKAKKEWSKKHAAVLVEAKRDARRYVQGEMHAQHHLICSDLNGKLEALAKRIDRVASDVVGAHIEKELPALRSKLEGIVTSLVVARNNAFTAQMRAEWEDLRREIATAGR